MPTSQFIRPRVYVAGPISQGDPMANCRLAIQVGFDLMDLGYAPYVPHYSYFVDPDSATGKGRYKQWLELDHAWIRVCHALLRIPGESKGADREVKWAQELGIPVFYDIFTLTSEVPPLRH